MAKQQDYLGDDFVDILGDLVKSDVKKKQGVAYIKGEHYVFYPSLNNFACAVCCSTISGEQSDAAEHVTKCLEKPLLCHSDEKFCYLCWRKIRTEHLSDHYYSVDHKNTRRRLEANNSDTVAFWAMKGGVSFVKPKDEKNNESIFFGSMDFPTRLKMTEQNFGFLNDAAIQIRRQIESAVRAASGNQKTATAKLGEASPLIVALRALANAATVGFFPCPDHQPKSEYALQTVYQALDDMVKLRNAELFSIVATDKKCFVCGNTLSAMKCPKKVFEAVVQTVNTIVGEKAAAAKRKSDEQPASKRPEPMDE